uniref:MFS domain-containing protein n=1 Tax=Caenorhabditis japonica TaxID=281687 RepID=A0A8R1EGV4_CAEJA
MGLGEVIRALLSDNDRAIFKGFVAPSYTTIIGNWFPASEKSTAVSMFTTGNQLAAAVGNPVVAAVCASDFGWPWIFYIA